MSSSQNETSSSSVGRGASKSFLQQTTSQLLHQQEALRRRREVLEKESRKPQVMRFGLSSPPRSRSPAPRTHSTSPLPPQNSAHSFSSAEPRGHDAGRDIRKEPAPALVNQPPMRFSLSYRPTPTPSATFNASLRTASTSPAPAPAPTPRNVNKASASSRSLSEKRKRPRHSHSHSHSHSRSHSSDSGGPERKENAHGVPRQPPYLPRPGAAADELGARDGQRHGAEEYPEESEESTKKRSRAEDLTAPSHAARDEEMSVTAVSLSGTVTSESKTNEEAPPPRSISGFPLPRYTPSHALQARLSGAAGTSPVTPVHFSIVDDGSEGRRGRQWDDGHGRSGEFPTPRPLSSRASHRGLPAPPPPRAPSPVDEVTPPRQQPLRETEGSTLAFSNTKEQEPAAREDGFPAPSPSGVEEGHQPFHEDRGAHRTAAAVPPSRRKASSPSPTPQNVAESVVAATTSDKRPCGCDRPTPSTRSCRSSHTTSPAPTPVSPTSERRQGTAHASQETRVGGRPAAVLAPAAASPSPLPTTENVVQSTVVSATNAFKGRRNVATEGDNEEEEEEEEEDIQVSEDSGNDAAPAQRGNDEWSKPREVRTPSPSLTPQHIIDSIHASAEKPTLKEEAVSRSPKATPAASPELTETEIAASVLTSLEKRRCGRQTPTAFGRPAPSLVQYTADSMSPIPTTEQLLDSLEVTAERMKGARAAEPAVERKSKSEGLDADSHAASRPGTLSPAPTQEHIQWSVMASADKRRNQVASPVSGSVSPPSRDSIAHRDHSAVSARRLVPPPVFPGRAAGAESEPAASPTVTPQHIEESVRKLAEDPPGHAARSAAPEPPNHSGSALRDPRGLSSVATANPSPEVTDENIQDSVGVLREEPADGPERSAAVGPTSVRQSSEEGEGEGEGAERADEGAENAFSNVNSEDEEGDDAEANNASVAATAGEKENALCRRQCAGGVAESAPPEDSPCDSDVCADSAMFKDCLSAALTPAVPHLPPQFLALQREVKAISEGRSRYSGSPVPPPSRRHAPPRSSTTPVAEATATNPSPRREGEAPPPSEAVGFVAAAAAESRTREAHTTAEGDAAAERMAADRRTSTVLVEGSAPLAFPALIQEPHQPMPAPLARTPPPVSIPLPPTPPPPPPPQTYRREKEKEKVTCDKQVQTPLPRLPPPPPPLEEPAKATRASHMLPDSHYEVGLSPLPRPVTLSSQVGKGLVPQHPSAAPSVPPFASADSQSIASALIDGPTPVHTVGTSVPPAYHRSAPLSASSVPISLSPREGRSTPYPRGSTLIPVGAFSAGEEGMPMYQGDSSDGRAEGNAETAGEHKASGQLVRGEERTLTVSLQGNAVVFMAHELGHTQRSAAKRPRDTEDETPTPRDSAECRQRRVTASSHSTTSRSSGLKAHTVEEDSIATTSPRPSRRSSGGGRRSTVERLLDMLPKETQEEIRDALTPSESQRDDDEHGASAVVAHSSEGAVGVAGSSPQGRSTADTTLSEVSDSGTGSSIAERVARRERRHHYDYDAYLAYLDEMARSSAKKARKANGKRMQHKILKDVQEGRKSPADASSAPPPSARAPQPSPPPRKSSRTSCKLFTPPSSTSSPLCASVASGTEASPGGSPCVTVSHGQAGDDDEEAVATAHHSSGSGGLLVTTRLSAELKTALFQPETPPKSASHAKPPTGKRKHTVLSRKAKLKRAKKAARKRESNREKAAVATVPRITTSRSTEGGTPLHTKSSSPAKSSPARSGAKSLTATRPSKKKKGPHTATAAGTEEERKQAKKRKRQRRRSKAKKSD